MNPEHRSESHYVESDASESDHEDLCTLEEAWQSRRDYDDGEWATSPQNESCEDKISISQLFERNKRKQRSLPIRFPTALLEFTTLHIDPTRSTKSGSPNLNFIRNNHVHTPLGIFSLFLPRNVLVQIVDNTNRYASSKGAGTGRPWNDVTVPELKAFFGLCLYMGVYRCPRIEDYWDKTGEGPQHSITCCMQLVRFQQIKRFLHVCDHTGDNGRSFFFKTMEPMFSTIVEMSQKLWLPSSYVSVDEMMMSYGRSSETVRMRNKPTSSGFKVWAICDSGYMYTAFLHSNKQPWTYCRSYKNVLPHSAAVIAKLSEV